jgi:Putative MetA-pathway of phenol degradation
MPPSKPLIWRKQGAAVAASLAFVGLVMAEPQSEQQAGPDPHPTLEQLLRRLEERDARIADLQQRVAALERQIATPASRAPPVNAPPLASSAEQVPSTQAEEPSVKSGAAPGQLEVDEEAAERALERTLVVTGALLLPFGKAEIQPSFFYTRSQQDAPIVFFEGGRSFTASQEVRRNSFDSDLFLRFGLPIDSQLELDIPYRYIDQEVVTEVDFNARAERDDHGSGFGDLRFGLAKGLLHERNGWPDLIGRVTWDTDSGDTFDDGVFLGGGFNELQGSLTMIKRQDPLAFIGTASYETTFEKDDINPGDTLSFSVGALLAASPESSLRVILNPTFVNELEVGDRIISGSDQVVGTLEFGVSSIIGRGTFLDLTAEMGLTDEAPDYSVGISLAVRFDIPTRF